MSKVLDNMEKHILRRGHIDQDMLFLILVDLIREIRSLGERVESLEPKGDA